MRSSVLRAELELAEGTAFRINQGGHHDYFTGVTPLVTGRRIAGVVSASLLAVGFAGLVAAPANAAAMPSYVNSYSGGANLRTCGNTGCASQGWMRNGSGFQMICWADTQWVYPPNSNYASPRWFKVWTSALGATGGWVHSSLVANQTPVPHC